MSIVRQIAREFVGQGEYACLRFDPPTKLPGGKVKPSKKAYPRTEGELPESYLDRHIEREPAFSVAVPLERPDGFRACVFDIDDHDATAGSRPREVARSIARHLTDAGYSPLSMSSGGGAGYHVWLFFEQPRRKDLVRSLMAGVLKALSLKEGTGGVGTGEIECFPKAGDRSLIALPYGMHSKAFALTPEGDLLQAEEPIEIPISNRKPGRKTKASAPVDQGAAFAAFVRAKDGADYDTWISVGFAVKAALGEDGFELFERWSADHSGYEGGEATRRKWEHDLRGGKTPPDHFWAVARANGYHGGFPPGIEIGKKGAEQAALLDLIAPLRTVRTPEDEVFAEIAPRSWEHVGSKAVHNHIRRLAIASGHGLTGSETLKSLSGYLDSQASEVGAVHVRCARDNDRVFYAVADGARTVYELKPCGLEVCENPPVRFKRGEGKPALVGDVGSLDDLRALVTVNDDNLVVLVAYLVKALLQPDTAHPILLLSGEAGSAKSSTLTTLVEALDPKPCILAAPPKTEEDLIVAAAANYLVSFDNLSSIGNLSDPLCRLATGGGLKRRAFYTNGDTFTLDVKRPVLLTGIDPEAVNQDFVQRMVRLELEPPVTRLSETQVNAIRALRLPGIRRYLLDAACRTLACPLPVIEQKAGRMMDFAAVGEAVARTEFGREPGWFTEFYDAMLCDAAEDEAQGDLVLQAVLMICANEHDQTLRGNCEQILRRVRDEVGLEHHKIFGDPHLLPKTARGLASRLAKAKPALKRAGFTVTQDSRRYWTIAGVQNSAREIPF